MPYRCKEQPKDNPAIIFNSKLFSNHSLSRPNIIHNFFHSNQVHLAPTWADDIQIRIVNHGEIKCQNKWHTVPISQMQTVKTIVRDGSRIWVIEPLWASEAAHICCPQRQGSTSVSAQWDAQIAASFRHLWQCGIWGSWPYQPSMESQTEWCPDPPGECTWYGQIGQSSWPGRGGRVWPIESKAV